MRDPASPIAGAHLEGPFLSPAHAGMHRPELLRSPSDAIPSYYSSPAVKLVTLAPELPGALELIHELRERGVAVALGHSGASAEEARAAVDAGARLITHLFNGMAPLHHRGPGLAGVALSDERLSVSVIADGVHVDPLVLRLVERLAGDRVVLVSDAGPLASSDADSATLGGVTISRAADGASQTADGRLAGSAILLDEAVRRWGDYTGATLAQAIQAASDRPARALGLATGLEPGASADLILLDDRGRLERTMHNGGWTD
jgi:N-acetylglucosamine-6-phosphate deacetylase